VSENSCGFKSHPAHSCTFQQTKTITTTIPPMNKATLERIINETDCTVLDTPFDFLVKPKGEGWTLQVMAQRPDTYTGEWEEGHGGKFYVSPHSSKDEVVKKCFAAALAYLEHELREGFQWRDKRIFGPHISLEALHSAADAVVGREVAGMKIVVNPHVKPDEFGYIPEYRRATNNW
jgi:hypothetical protein